MKKLLIVVLTLFASFPVFTAEPGKVYPAGVAVPVTARVCFSAVHAMEIATVDVEMGTKDGGAVFRYHESLNRCVNARGAQINFTGVVRLFSGKYGTVEMYHGSMYFEMSRITQSVYVLTDPPAKPVWCTPTYGRVCT